MLDQVYTALGTLTVYGANIGGTTGAQRCCDNNQHSRWFQAQLRQYIQMEHPNVNTDGLEAQPKHNGKLL